MTDTTRCEPPPEWLKNSFHWVTHQNLPLSMLWEWQPRYTEWKLPYRLASEIAYQPEQFASLGYTYLAPCRPDDATERVRLEAENAQLRTALDIAQQGLMIISGQQQCIDNLMSNQDVAFEALRLIKEANNV